jgi:hypothetical protein
MKQPPIILVGLSARQPSGFDPDVLHRHTIARDIFCGSLNVRAVRIFWVVLLMVGLRNCE